MRNDLPTAQAKTTVTSHRLEVLSIASHIWHINPSFIIYNFSKIPHHLKIEFRSPRSLTAQSFNNQPTVSLPECRDSATAVLNAVLSFSPVCSTRTYVRLPFPTKDFGLNAGIYPVRKKCTLPYESEHSIPFCQNQYAKYLYFTVLSLLST